MWQGNVGISIKYSMRAMSRMKQRKLPAPINIQSPKLVGPDKVN
jgi:hypothetical protein